MNDATVMTSSLPIKSFIEACLCDEGGFHISASHIIACIQQDEVAEVNMIIGVEVGVDQGDVDIRLKDPDFLLFF